jgi:predicted regulator of Ras-like GTPase activity (Roadblock/LC7/MglB family)
MPRTLTRTDERKFQHILRNLVEHAEADGCVLCGEVGHVIAQYGTTGTDSEIISALGAGVFSASRELARLLGEDKFSAVVHQGEKKSVYIGSVNAEVLLVVAFSIEASLGLVKLYAAPAAAAMRAILDGAASRPAEQQERLVLSESKNLFALKDQP